ncbi:hypothetical protein MAJHIDBO_01210 [Propionibacterium freudenreichii subsp. shermanii]|nr:hypothetical protein MAJHIDBO_01210 [Propionibacterium freudenreichii subsp. shermanii]SPS09005.1 hypothetical protein MAJHIDBO_01210 [Propionibacterium freudenreichii subsp. shermanii]
MDAVLVVDAGSVVDAASLVRTLSSMDPPSTVDAVSTRPTQGLPWVRVPVLSKATWRTAPNSSKAAPLLITRPNLLAAPMAETTVTGTAMASAHGEAATSTTRARGIHTSGLPSNEPSTPTATARMSTPGTRGAAMRSARRARRPFFACACSTRVTIVVSELSLPGAVALTCNGPEMLMHPAETASREPTCTGIDSPVMAEVSSELAPSRTTPSVATRSPGRTSRRSPTCSCDASTSVGLPSTSTVAVFGVSSSRARRPLRARSMALSSSASEMEYRKARAAASATAPRMTAPMALIIINRLMPRRPFSRARRAPGTKVDAPSSRPAQ